MLLDQIRIVAKTINEAFNILISRLTPSDSETESVRNYRQSIEECLKKNFSITNFFRTGSTSNGTGINGHSDTDYFAVIPTQNLKSNSSDTLNEVMKVLKQRLPNTGVYVDNPAVICPFGTLSTENTEIVPAGFIVEREGYNIYEISDRKGGWIHASPLAHNSIVNNENERLNNKVKPLIRYLKAWKYYSNVPISSFYIEMTVVEYISKQNSIAYSIDINNILSWLFKNNLSPLWDPTGISGLIFPCKTENEKVLAFSKLSNGLKKTNSARESETNDDIESAFQLWNEFYNGYFPIYY